MSASAWLMDAIHASTSKSVPTVPNLDKMDCAQGNNKKTLINDNVVCDVPIVPSVPNNMPPSMIKPGMMEIERERRHAKVLNLMEGKRFAVLVEDDKTDPIIATIGIQSVATFEMTIPLHSYDGMVLLELIEKHYGENYANS